MASSRLLQLVLSTSAAIEIVSLKKWPLRRSNHVVAARTSSKEIQHLQFKIEGVITEVGGKMVVADMRFTRDGFDYWRNAAIPSNSIVRDLASTWANMDSISTTPSIPFKFFANRTVGKKMEDFLQRMVAEVEQRITREGFNPLEGSRLHVQLADEQESMVAMEGNLDSNLDFDRRLDVKSVDEQESMVQELDKTEAKQGSNRSKDVPFADEQGLVVKEGKPEVEQAFDRRLESQELRAKEEKIEAEQEFDGRVDLQLLDEQVITAKVEKSQGKPERLHVQESVMKDETSEDMQVQSAAKRGRIVTCLTQQQGAAAQKDKLENLHVKEKGIERKLSQLVADGQKAMEKEKKSEAIHRIEEKEGAEMQKAGATKRLASKQESMGVFMKSAACTEQQAVDVQNIEAVNQHVEEEEIVRKDINLAADEQKAMEKEKKSEGTHRVEKREGTEMQRREARKQVEKDYSLQQTDNIVWKTRRMGKKVVHIYYDKSSAGGVSL